MKRAVFTCAAILVAGPACAADMAARPALFYAPPPALNWAGWYAGVNAGYGWGAGAGRDISAADPIGAGVMSYLALTGPAFPNLKPAGFIGGGQIGYDWQGIIASIPNLVTGVVADFQGASITASGSATVTPPQYITSTQSWSEKLNFLGTLRGRLGIAAGNWLVYGSAGLAYGQVRSALSFTAPGFPNGSGPGAFFSGSRSETGIGWAAGGGVNYALTPNWILGADYLHYDLGRTSVTAAMQQPGEVIPGTMITASQAVAGDIVRATVNYKF